MKRLPALAVLGMGEGGLRRHEQPWLADPEESISPLGFRAECRINE